MDNSKKIGLVVGLAGMAFLALGWLSFNSPSEIEKKQDMSLKIDCANKYSSGAKCDDAMSLKLEAENFELPSDGDLSHQPKIAKVIKEVIDETSYPVEVAERSKNIPRQKQLLTSGK